MTATRRFLLLILLSTGLGLLMVGGGLAVLMHAADEWRLYDPEVIANDTILWGGAFGQNRAGYKFARTRHYQPELLILGSSRVTQFRAQMLPGIRVYNAGGAAASLWGARTFLEGLYRQHQPKILVLGIDEWWFRNEPGKLGAEQAARDLAFNRKEIAANLIDRLGPQLIRDILAPHAASDPLGGRPTVGLRARALASGFRPDGSDQYGNLILGLGGYDPRTTHDMDFIFYRQAIERNKDRFSYSGPVAGKAVENLRAILSEARQRGVRAVVVLSPYPHAVWEEIQASPNHRRFHADVEAAVSRVTAETGAELHVTHDLAELGLDDSFS